MKRLFFIIAFAITVSISFSQTHLNNPVLNANFPDPTIIRVGDKYFAYATNGGINGKNYNIPVASSTDLQNWNIEGDALPQKPSWATKDFWAPHVLFDKKIDKYVLFYSGEQGENTGKCIGVAFSDKPEGPFIDKGSPLISGEGFINIDPFAFVDPESGRKLLYWGSGHQPIKVQELNEDWRAFKAGSKPQPLINTDEEKKYDRLVEGAWVDYHKGKYYLYYSGDNCCGENANYAVLVARAKKATGPFRRLGEHNGSGNSVILEKNDSWLALGHNSIFRDKQGKVYIAYHAIPLDKQTNKAKNSDRVMLIRPIKYKDGWPVVIDN
ncbi:glycoside hydrolase family 43 protein [Paradesertivirga mongoliensis]|uniref:Glycoside hydrolase family 43 protein n=1 Tax=Paradesertivirga mongoliensis TaxID=2100740 RepID=A0ABW4ZLS6_9SPHI|nr:glycoside hydrolase family 43 protein [Pedobacter mongoliensis]